MTEEFFIIASRHRSLYFGILKCGEPVVKPRQSKFRCFLICTFDIVNNGGLDFEISFVGKHAETIWQTKMLVVTDETFHNRHPHLFPYFAIVKFTVLFANQLKFFQQR